MLRRSWAAVAAAREKLGDVMTADGMTVYVYPSGSS